MFWFKVWIIDKLISYFAFGGELFMEIFNTLLGVPLGYVMFFCYQLVGNYGVSILLFTVLTKVIMFPLSVISQKNSIIMVKMQPQLEDIKQRYAGNNALLVEEQKALYAREHYSTIKGMLPLLVQIPIILGLINVIYNPLQHLLHMDPVAINALVDQAVQSFGIVAGDSGTQLRVMELVQTNPQVFAGLTGVDQIMSVDLSFLGLNMAQVPSLASLTVIYPILSGVSALILCMYQNKYNVLQQAQGFLGKWGMTIFLIAFSAYFAAVLPCGIGLYWIAGNFLSILVLALCNKIYDPRKHIDYESIPVKIKLSPEEKAEERRMKKLERAREKVDKKRFAAQKNKQLVFYSESSGFYKYFERLIDYILAHSDIVIHYVTNDYNDQIFQNQNPRIEKYYIGPVALIQFMMLMDADMIVMTTPDLEQYHLKRSLIRKDVEYIYIDHAITSFHLTLRKGALDHFDTIFCYGPNQVKEVRETERVYGLPPKNIVKTGYSLVDTLLESAAALGEVKNDPKVILIAPSWQKDNILEYCLGDTLRPLLSIGYKVIVRPHPEFVKRFPMKIKAIQDKYCDELGENFVLETDFSSNTSVYTADLVITDWSAIAQEFSYATKKPSLFINTPMKVMNPEYEKIPLVPLEISQRDEIGVSIDIDQLDTIPQIIEEFFQNREKYKEQITEVLNRSVFDIGRSGEAGGKYIIQTLNEIKQLREQKINVSQVPVPQGDEPNENLDMQREDVLNLAQEIFSHADEYEDSIDRVLSETIRDEGGSVRTKADYLLELFREIKRGKETDGGQVQ